MWRTFWQKKISLAGRWRRYNKYVKMAIPNMCWGQAVCWWCSGHCNITISRGPGFDPQARQEKEIPMSTLVCSCGSFVELFFQRSDPFRGITIALASNPRWARATRTSAQVYAPLSFLSEMVLQTNSNNLLFRCNKNDFSILCTMFQFI